MRVEVPLAIPATEFRLEFEHNPLLVMDDLGRVSGIEFTDYGPLIIVTLPSGDQVVLLSEMDTWFVGRPGQDESMDIDNLARLVGRPDDPDAVHDAFEELWRLANRLIAQITNHVGNAVARDLTRTLDEYTHSILF
ncbi:hypothetical protein [Amycolatopsis tolypomycina]|uniref:hypothetical protein n=1 Tax=Amycolatopsis tolypomycina TaxID=208445 RepID=UPI0033B72AEE